MWLIDVKAFLSREEVLRKGGKVDRQTKVLKFHNGEVTPYAILSHRWTDFTEVDYEEIVKLATMDMEDCNEIRRRLGYKKILDTCEQAGRDGYEWIWVDTCCIDKRSSAELSEAINSMYRWYENSRVCYVYLHDVPGSSFPTVQDDARYPDSNGWPEWFSRGWTLQEMIAPSNVQFFNKDWQLIGDKKEFTCTLQNITRVPERVLTDGLSGNRPCIAQIMSWAAKRTTTRIEDRAYSLMGLLDVNMPMLYGEGRKAFHRLQLEIIRTSTDQSIFAWGSGWSKKNVRTGSILADDPSFFEDCFEIELMDYDEFIESLKKYTPVETLRSMDQDRFGIFPVTNRGIQIWMFLLPHPDSQNSIFEAWLPCREDRSLVSIELALLDSNYYRYSLPLKGLLAKPNLQLRQVYLRYQDTMYPDVTFEIDDSAIFENGFTCCDTYPSKPEGNTVTPTSTSPLCVRTYTGTLGKGRFSVSLGQYFGRDWVHLINNPPNEIDKQDLMLRGPRRAQSLVSRVNNSPIWVHHIYLPELACIVRTSRVVWERSRIGVRMEVWDSDLHNGLDGWKVLEADVRVNGPSQDIRGLMMSCNMPCSSPKTLCVDGVQTVFFLVDKSRKLGDYGSFTDSGHFSSKGNIFDKITSIPGVDIAPRQSKVTSETFDIIQDYTSLPPLINSSLTSLSPLPINAYLVTRVAQCIHKVSGSDIVDSNTAIILCTFEKPFVWHRDEVPSTGKIPGGAFGKVGRRWWKSDKSNDDIEKMR